MATLSVFIISLHLELITQDALNIAQAPDGST